MEQELFIHRQRIVLHVDMDAFFASIEEHDKPRLKGMPIVVGSDPKEGVGRGVVATANYVARKYGIHSAQPISEAWRLSEAHHQRGMPRVVFIEGNHQRYSEISGAIMAYLRGASGAFEEASIDEAYIELATDGAQSSEGRWSAAEKLARQIKAHIKKEFGLTCSVGIGPNKLIAKLAAGMEKPDGLTVVHYDQVQSFLDPQPVRALPGVGPKTEQVLFKFGAHTICELRGMNEAELIERLGAWGRQLFLRARGIDEGPVIEKHDIKSVGEQETFEKDTRDASLIIERLRALAYHVSKRLTSGKGAGRTISITVRFSDFETVTRAHTLAEPTTSADVIFSEALKLFLPFLDSRENPKKKYIRLIGVRVEKLEGIQHLL